MINTKSRDNRDRGRVRKRISPALVLSVVALFAALSGAAVALPGTNTVGSGDIIDGKVKTPDLKDGDVNSSDLAANSVNASELADGIHSHSDTVSVGGGTNENAAYNTVAVTAECSVGEELISGSGNWTGDAADEELFLSEIQLDHTAESVTVRGGNDIGSARTLVAVAHCLG